MNIHFTFPNYSSTYTVLVALFLCLFTTKGQANGNPSPNESMVCPTATEVFINEFHYDNTGIDANEFVEVAVLNSFAATLSDISLFLYNGSGGVTYGTSYLLSTMVVGANDGTYTYYSVTLPANGLQNGAPDGLALSCLGTAFEFISYEGVITATNGPANGMTSVDILAAQADASTPLGSSLQKIGGLWFNTCGENTKGNTNDRPAVAIEATNASQMEGNAGTTAFTFTLTRTGLITGATTVTYTVTGSGASPADAADFGGTLPTNTVTFAANSTSEILTINVSGDVDLESDEEFTVTLTSPGCGTNLTTPTALGTILDDDVTTAVLDIAATDASKPEGNAGTTPFTFTVTRIGITTGTSSATYTVTGSGANPADAADFGGSFPSGMVNFAPTETSAIITVDVTGDVAIELDETFTVTLSDPVNAVINTATADGTILDDDNTATDLAIVAADAVKLEGNTGTTAFTFTVNRTGNISGTSAADYAVTGSGANPADAADFGGTLPSGTVNFVASQMSATITIDVSGDFTVEPDESFTVTLSNPTNAVITTPTADGTIQNEDTPCPTSADVFVNEFHYDNIGGDVSEFVEVAVLNTFTLTPLSGITLSLYNGSNGTTYTPSNTLNNLVAGTNDGTYTYYTVTFPQDGLQNGAPDGLALSCGGVAFEFISYEGVMTATNGPANGQMSTDVLAVESGTTTPVGSSIQKIGSTWFTICSQNTLGTTNARPTVAIAATDANKPEGNAGTTAFTFTVTRSGLTTGATTVNYVVTGTGANPADAADFGGSFPPGSVTFAASSVSETITIDVSGDTDVEPNEEFTVTLTDVAGCGTDITTATATGTILDDDGSACPATLAVSGAIASGTYVAAMDITSDGTVGNTAVVAFKAGNSIELQMGFEVEVGGEFDATIEACVPFQGNGSGDE